MVLVMCKVGRALFIAAVAIGVGAVESAPRFAYSQTLAGDAISAEAFGAGLAVGADGKWMAIGARHGGITREDDLASGIVYLFRRSGDEWTPAGHLLPPHPEVSVFGASVAMYGGLLVVGATATNEPDAPFHGSAHVYELVDDEWRHQHDLIPDEFIGGAIFGSGVHVHDGVIVVVAFSGDGPRRGAAYVFRPGTDGWVVSQRLTATGSHTFAPSSLNESALVVASGAIDTVYVFGRTGDVFAETPIAIERQSPGRFGGAIALFGDHLLVSEIDFEDVAEGAAHLYRLATDGFAHHIREFRMPTELGQAGLFGATVGLSEDLIAVSAPWLVVSEDLPSPAADRRVRGAVFTWTRDGTLQQRLALPDVAFAGQPGFSMVYLAGDELYVANPDAMVNGIHLAGTVYAFRASPLDWRDLSLEVSAMPAVVRKGETVSFAASMENRSEHAVEETSLVSAIPQGMEWIPLLDDCMQRGQAVHCEVGRIPGHATATRTLEYTVNAATFGDEGPNTNIMVVRSAHPEADTLDNVKAATVTVEPPDEEAEAPPPPDVPAGGGGSAPSTFVILLAILGLLRGEVRGARSG